MRKIYLNLFTVLLFLFAGIHTNAQLSGTKTIPGDYATIAAAVTDLNAQGVGAGGVTFNVAAGHTETLTATISITATGTVANPIIFQKSGAGANPLLTAYTGGTAVHTTTAAPHDGLIRLVGSDYVTIDGIDLTENAANATNAARMEYGYALLKASVTNGCHNNTIKNCTITLNRANATTGTVVEADNGSTGIWVANTLPTGNAAVVITDPSGSNSFNKFYSNTIQNCNTGIYLRGYISTGNLPLYDQGNDVGGSSVATGNTIINFGGGGVAVTAHAIRGIYQNNFNFSYNTINNNNGSGVNHTSTLRGIFMSTGTSSSGSINNNTVTLHGGATTSALVAIENTAGSTAASNTIDINNNTVQNSTYATATSGAFTGIDNGGTAAVINMNNNTVANNTLGVSGVGTTGIFTGIVTTGAATSVVTVNNNIVNNNTKVGTSGNFYCIRPGTGIVTVNGNTIFNNTFNSVSGTTSANLHGIQNSLGSGDAENYTNNTIYNLTLSSANTSTTNTVNGIITTTDASSVKTIANNTIYNLQFTNTATGSATVTGINHTTAQTVNIYKNKIYDLLAVNGASSIVVGITHGTTTTTANIYNNLIGNLQAQAASGANAVIGINITNATANGTSNVSFNTVYLNATSTGTNFGSSGIYHTGNATATTGTLVLRSNIFVNTSTPAGTGFTVAYRRSSTAIANYGSASNNNLFYSGTPSPTKLIFYDGTNADQTIGDYKSRVAPIDANSVSEDPPFLSTTGSNVNFLHINPAVATQIESGGTPVAGITDDFDGDTRNATTPDIGADEFTGVSADLSAPTITYTELIAACNTSNRTLSGVTITDASGVPTAGPLMPRIYYRKNGGSWFSQSGTLASGTGTNGTWDFTIVAADMGGIAFGDVISYYIIAQDQAPAANLASSPTGVVATNVNTVTTHPPSPNFYVVGQSLSGTYSVGAAHSLKTLSDAVAVYNGCPISGPVIFSLTDATYSTSELFPIIINQNAGASSTNTLTIQPAAGTAVLISGSGSPLIDFNGADYIRINGVNAGGSTLTIRNTSTTGATLRFIADATNITVENAILEAAVTSTTQGVVFLSSGTTTGNDNISILNNTIRDRSDAPGVPANLIYSSSGSGTILNSNITVSGNILKNFTSTGINVAGTGTTNGNENWTITLNEIFQEASRTTSTGITFSNQGTGLISQNYIHDLIATSTYNGISLNDSRNTTVSRNRIIQATVAGSTGTWTGIAFNGNTTGDPTVTIVNNQISLIPTTTADQIIRGILDNSAADHTANIYYNSVLIGGTATGTDDTYAFIRESSVPSVANVLNNIFFNNRTGGTGNHFAGGDQSMGTGTFNSNYNIWVGTGATPANIMDRSASTTVTPMTFAAWQATTGTPDLNSQGSVAGVGNFTVAGFFVSPTDLHAAAGANPPANAGTPITGITTDYDNDTRSATTPDIGADEFTSTPADLSAPSMVYTALGDSCNTGNRMLRVAITDLSGVPTTGVLQPRIYYRKNAGAWFSSQGTLMAGDGLSGTWDFSIIAADMGGLAGGDIVEYYVIAQDILNNIGAQPGTGLVATNVNTVTTHPTNPNNYDVLTILNGTYTVGATGNYTTLTAAVNAYNTVCIGGPVVFELIDANYSTAETFPIVINQNATASAVNTLTIRPAAGIAAIITGTSTSGALIDLNGADYVTINGVNAAGSSLLIRNTSTTIPTIRFINDATNNTITNSTIEGGVTSTTAGQVVFSTSASGTTGNSNNAITNNVIRERSDAVAAMGVGISSSGTTAAPNQDNTITGNHFRNFTAIGVNITATGNGDDWTISNNHFFNNLTPSTAQSAITIATASTGIVINNNFIGGNAPNAAGTWTNSGNVAINALNITNGVVTITNNTIANITGTNTGTTTRTRGINFTSDMGNSLIQGNTIFNLLSSGAVTSYTAGSQAAVGIHYFPGGYQPITIKRNTIYNISIENTAALTTSNIAAGMVLTNMGGEASENRIYGIKNKSTGTTAGQPPIAAGMYVRFLTGSVINNMVSIGAGESNNVQQTGILVAGGTATNTATINFYYNSVLVSGTATGTNSSYAFLRGDNSTTSALQTVTLRNNILANTRSGGGSSNFAIGNQGTEAAQLWSSNYNVLYSADPATVGYWNNAAQTFAGWQTASAGDVNSVNVMPQFVSVEDLHLVTGLNPLINNAGTPITGVTTDYDNDTRNATTPDIGADEFTPSVAIDVQALTLVEPIVKTCYTNAETVKITIRNNSAVTHDFTLFPVTVNGSVTGPNAVTFTPVIINTGTLAAGASMEVVLSTNYNMSAAGTYTFNASTTVAGDVNTGNDAMTPVVRTVTAVNAGTVTSSHSAYCVTGGTPTLTLTGSAGGTIQWQESTASATGPWTNVGTGLTTYTPASAITATSYYQAVVSCGTNTATTNVVTVELNNPQVLTTVEDSVCVSGVMNLQATSSAGATLRWYDVPTGGTPLATGTTFTTPNLNTTTTYYVAATAGGGGSTNVGLTSTTGATSGAGTTNFGIVFDVLSPFTLQTVTVYPVAAAANTPGTVTIDVINGAGAILHTATVNVVGNPVASIVGQTVTLNFNLVPGTNYKIRPGSRGPGITGLLFGPSAAAPPGGNYGYPFTVPGVVTLLHSTLTAAPTNTPRLDLYYYFYNWQISTGCESARVPVMAKVSPATVGGTASANQSICVGATPANITLAGHTGNVIRWERSTNAAFTTPTSIANTTTTLTGAQIGALNVTTYFRAVVKSGACNTENSSVVTVTVANPTATVSYPSSPYCLNAGTANVTLTGSTGGTFTASPAGLSINASTGNINLGASTPGTYTVTYSIAATGSCPAFSTTAQVAISPAGTWLGVTSSDWHTASNWCGGIPTPTTDVVIPSAAPNMPNLNNGTGTVRNLTINNGGMVTVSANGRLDLYGNISGAGAFNASAGHLAFMGSTNQITPSLTVRNVTMNGESWTPGGNSTITGNLVLTDGHVILGNNDLVLHNTSTGSVGSHIIINGTGRVIVPDFAASSSMVIPIGGDISSYNPVWLVSNAGHVTDDFTIGLQPGVFINGVSGAYFTSHVVARTWLIQEGTTGGSNVNVTLQWTADQETPGFDRAKSYMTVHNGTAWPQGVVLPAGGSNPYTHTRQNVTTFGSFSIQTQSIPRPVTGIYPNPTSSQLNVVVDLTSQQPVRITVFDATGKLVMDRSVAMTAGVNLHTLNVSHLSGGVYFIKVSISSNPEYMLTKFVKQ